MVAMKNRPVGRTFSQAFAPLGIARGVEARTNAGRPVFQGPAKSANNNNTLTL